MGTQAIANDEGQQLRIEFNKRKSDNQNIIEAVLFTLGRAVTVQELAKACSSDNRTAEQEVRELMKILDDEDGALIIREIDGKYQLCSSPKYFDHLVNVVSAPKKPELSDVLMETLAIIANKSPATRMDIEKIRGVKSDFAVNKLIEYGLIEEAGKLNVPGRPAIFRPTDEFYRRFGIENKYGMPGVDEAMESKISDEVQLELKDIIGEV
ncbi:MAG: SMC-Scp complex subunit ScpB [Eubacteriales bacterium]|nr:SMC-Scp complex subunit ScpB [Eubacteriales bacterium]